MQRRLSFEEGVRAILRDAGLGEAREIYPLAGGLSNTVYGVDGRLVVRIGAGPDGHELPKAASVLRAVAGRVAAPTLLHADFSGERVPANVLICSFVAGERLAEIWPRAQAAKRQRLVRAVWLELDALHAVPPHAIGYFRELAPWPERKEGRVRAALARARATEAFELARLDRMEAYLAANVEALRLAGPEVPVHCDVQWENVIVRREGIAALLDFDDVELAPAEADVWELLFAVGAGDAPDAPLYGIEETCGERMSAPGALERLAIDEIEEILNLACEELGWISRADARVEADRAYGRVFESDFYARLLARVTGRQP